MNIVRIPIRPYSSGESNLAKIMLTKKVTPNLVIFSKALQATPLIVLCFSDSSVIMNVKNILKIQYNVKKNKYVYIIILNLFI